MNDLRLEIRFKNAVLYEAIHTMWGHVAAARQKGPMLPIMQVASEKSGLSQGRLRGFLSMTNSPFSARTGDYTAAALKLAMALESQPEALFPAHLYRQKFPRCVVKHVDSVQFLSLHAARHLALPAPDEGPAADQEDQRKLIGAALENLTERQRDIIIARFGLDDMGERSLTALATAKNVSKERIRQIEAKALHKLRHPSLSHKLRPLLDDLR